jgi:hypothetical protein
MRRMKRIETTIAFNMASRVSNHRYEESTVWNPDKVLPNHNPQVVAVGDLYNPQKDTDEK